MNLLVTICARGGSKGVKNKNIRPLNGKPLIVHTIEHALIWGKGTHYVVSTDSLKIEAIAKQFPGVIPFIRPYSLALDKTPKVEVIRHALFRSEEIFNVTYDAVCDLDVTAPLRRISDIENCYLEFLSKKPLTLFSVVASHRNPYFNMVEAKKGGYVSLCKKLSERVYRRQDAPKVYDMNASIYFYQRNYLSKPETRSALSKRSLVYEMDRLSAFDIDYESDFRVVEYLLKKRVLQ